MFSILYLSQFLIDLWRALLDLEKLPLQHSIWLIYLTLREVIINEVQYGWDDDH